MKKLLLLLILCQLSCATVDHVPINSDKKDTDNTGIRYYESSPYLLVYSNGKGGIVAQILHLPDPNKKMSATPKAFVAQLKTSMHFKDGVLTSATDTADATAFPKAVLEAAKTIALARGVTEDSTIDIPAPYLYKIVIDGDQMIFKGGQGTESFKITYMPKAKK